ncbi:ScbR family autoregulator-binding transcription factor [Streptomyces sp. NPDC053048]|uniref:ScbR family autoregulator-binding transcription factor n=1 Tax=Streptomyces sp. NPDC053048 TaxID=3365694 RepID=UPI0037D98B4B
MTRVPAEWTRRRSLTEQRPHPSQDRAVQTRAAILRAAAKLFSEHGFSGTSLQGVAEELGMTKGAVYHHFTNKESLAVALVEEHYARWPILLEDVKALGLPPLETCRELLDRVALAFHRDVVVQASARLQLERSLFNAPLPVPYVGWTELLSSLLADAKEAGQLRVDVVPEVAAGAIVSGFFGVQHVSDALHRRSDLPDRWREMGDLVFRSISAVAD